MRSASIAEPLERVAPCHGQYHVRDALFVDVKEISTSLAFALFFSTTMSLSTMRAVTDVEKTFTEQVRHFSALMTTHRWNKWDFGK